MRKSNAIGMCSSLLGALALFFAGVSGCGGGGIGGAGTSTLRISGSGAAVSALGSTSKDASGFATGTTGGALHSVNDHMVVTCAFSWDAFTQQTDIQITGDSGNCSNTNACIVCTPSSGPNACAFTCVGTVPSNATTSIDHFYTYYTATATASSDMHGTGEVKFRAVTNGTLGTYLDLTTAPTFDATGCNGAPATEMALGAITEEASALADRTDSASVAGVAVAAGTGNCVVTAKFTVDYPLAALETPGFTLDLSGGTITQTTKMCDDPTPTNCTLP